MSVKICSLLFIVAVLVAAPAPAVETGLPLQGEEAEEFLHTA
jgi:hypothetical protein